MKNTLYYGDNLTVLREQIPDESVDLIYLDPPFNSSRNYNLLFKQVKGNASPAQIMAFEDTWTWSPLLYDQFRAEPRNSKLFPFIASLYAILGPSEMMAYVLMMAPRLLELHRTLKPTGSLYLHCDPAASHYLKIVLDVVFLPTNFRNEIVWKRSSAHNDSKQGMRRLGKVHDVVLFYTRSGARDYTWNTQFTPYEQEYLDSEYKHKDANGRSYKEGDLTAAKPGGETSYLWRVKRRVGAHRHWTADLTAEWRIPLDGWEYKGVPPYNGRYWAYSYANLVDFWKKGNLIHRSTGAPRLVFYADEMPGVQLQDIWTDIVPTPKGERRGYPTQKPLALLERIIAASSNEGDVVMDPFCGCGTAIVAAERMNRKWIGIDITYLAISEVIYRLNTECVVGKKLEYDLKGTPVDAHGAQKLFEQTAPQNHKPFEQWCVSLVAGESRDKKGADRGIDGVIHLWDSQGKLRKAVIQVKGGNLTLSAVRDFASVIKDNDGLMGLMITLRDPTKEMILVCEQQGYAEIEAGKRFPKMQIRTVKELLENPKRPFEFPDSWRTPRTQGVGMAQQAGQEELAL